MNKIDINGIGMTSKRTRDRLVNRLKEKGIRSENVLRSIATVPRHLFVDEALSHRAYEDTALPIGFGQTLSQPYIVAKMTQSLLSTTLPVEKVLEIGTGSGYQAAILSSLVSRVYSIERIQPLFAKASRRLKTLSHYNVHCKCGDGWNGWSIVGPFDGIMVTAAPQEIPDALLAQLSPKGGRMVIPVGDSDQQRLLILIRNQDEIRTEEVELVRFVPLLPGVVR